MTDRLVTKQQIGDPVEPGELDAAWEKVMDNKSSNQQSIMPYLREIAEANGSAAPQTLMAAVHEIERLCAALEHIADCAASDVIRRQARRALSGDSSTPETTKQPARDAEHCDFPDCEQHWRVLLQRCVAGWQKGNDIAGPMLVAAKELGLSQETNVSGPDHPRQHATMSLESSAGTRVQYMDCNGYPGDTEHCKRAGLIKDKTYEVAEVDVYSDHSTVRLKGFDGWRFNTVCFCTAEKAIEDEIQTC